MEQEIKQKTEQPGQQSEQKTEQRDAAAVKIRYHMLDSLRGFVILVMIAYHGAWNMVNLYGMKVDFLKSAGGYILQQAGCWCFILLSGFCWSMGRRPLKRGLVVFAAGLLVTAVTLVVMPKNRIVFGVLTLLGSCMLLMIPFDKWLRRVPKEPGFFVSFLLFVLTRNVNTGYLGFESWNLVKLPVSWYQGLAAAYLGFMPKNFHSTDYFSLFPWFFLFVAGYFLYGICKKRNWLDKAFFTINIPFLSYVGRNSLIIYLLHQPVLYIIGEIFL